MFEVLVFGDVALSDCWWRSCDIDLRTTRYIRALRENLRRFLTYLQTPINCCEPSGLKLMLVSEPSEHFDLYSKFHINSWSRSSYDKSVEHEVLPPVNLMA
jgi:hypothetical protein